MVLLIRKQYLAAGSGVLLLIALALGRSGGPKPSVPALAGRETSEIVVVDAGHGGEDGGAVASDGTVESGINLKIAARVNDLLRFCGLETRMIRREDVSVYDSGVQTLREKKVSDLKNRVAIVNGLEGAVLLSIHQNCFPASPSVHGAQVFYNTGALAPELALAVQMCLNETVNAGGEKQSKPISKDIYLMKNVSAPAVLVECGFLSNREETQALKTPEYQRTLAAAITAGMLRGLAAGEEQP